MTRSHQEDVNSRMARYALAMGIRTVCFVLIFVLPWPWKWFAAGGAILLPYVAVLIANAGRERLPVAWGSRSQAGSVPSPHRETPEAPPEQLAPVQVVQGETVERPEPARPADGPGERPGERSAERPGGPGDGGAAPLHRAS